MGKNKLSTVNFCRLLDIFGEEAARETLDDVNAGRCRELILEKYIYDDVTKDEYAERLKNE